MSTFLEVQRQLLQEIDELQKEVPVDFAEQAIQNVEHFFANFVSAEHSMAAAQVFEKQWGAEVEIDLGTPLQYLLEGTGEHGPSGEGFIVTATHHNVLSWEANGERVFASFVYNPGMAAKFSEEEMYDAMYEGLGTNAEDNE